MKFFYNCDHKQIFKICSLDLDFSSDLKITRNCNENKKIDLILMELLQTLSISIINLTK